MNNNFDEERIKELETNNFNIVNGKQKSFLDMLKAFCKKYFIDAFSGMAQGLFCTLIAGTILYQIGTWIGADGSQAAISAKGFFTAVGNVAKSLMGAGIGIGIAHALKAKKLVLLTAAVAGFAGAFADKIIGGSFATFALGAPGNPIGAYIVAVLAIKFGDLVCGKTKVDIVIVPLTMMAISIGGLYVSWPFIKLVDLIGQGIGIATMVTPEAMGIIVAVCMGILLTLPTSSAAIWLAIAGPILAVGSTASVDIQNAMLIAGGAACTGCCCHMVGFGVQSYRENRFGGLIAQGLGTSMLQIPNLMRHPQILLPPIIASVIAGPLSSCVFMLKCNAAGGGMGTAGLVGVFGTIEASGMLPDWQLGLGIALCYFIIPAVVCLIVTEIMRKFKFIKPDYMKLEL